jgi:hypothetical protein
MDTTSDSVARKKVPFANINVYRECITPTGLRVEKRGPTTAFRVALTPGEKELRGNTLHIRHDTMVTPVG